ncbi:M14 family zinc carboxypeptidase [Oxalicibacterium flavum]|uniref:M14 family zinc carboxypeptidase n=1 Tax=Oxalicibacterium flavum TaxID=179467 RepID=UPI00166DA15D|nr:M14 family zinc carboxypeptidase [Oxalicibacterium flavum]
MRISTAFGNCLVPLVLACGLALPSSAAAAPPQELAPEQWCERLIPRLPTVTQALCLQGGFAATGRHSLQGFPLIAKDVPAVNRRKRPLRVLLMGGIHGDELTSAAIIYRWVADMNGPLAQSMDWRIMPVVNPDGLLAKKASRMNANGVDLNRNFPTPGWETEAPRYWQVRTRADPRRFPGMAPLSEPESRWVEDEMHGFRPDVIISVHAPFGVLDFDGPAQPPHRFGRLMLNRVGIYPGSLGNYGGVHRKVPVITIELPNAQQMPSQAEVRRIWVDMVRWIADNVRARSEKDVQAADDSAPAVRR